MNIASLAVTLLIPLTVGGSMIQKADNSNSGDFYKPDIEKFCNLEVTCDGASGPRIPVQLPQGRDGRDGDQGPAGPQGPQGPPGPPGTTSSDVRPSAFMARLTAHRYAANFESDASVLLYDTSEPNVGDDYNITTGKYTAPRNGTYSFSITMAAHAGKEAAGELRTDVGTGYIGRVWVISRPKWTSASSSFIVHLNEGQSVWVQPIKRAREYYGNSYCTFSGYVLFYD